MTLFKRRLQIVEGIFEIQTNAAWLATAEEYFGPHDVQSLLTNYYTVQEVANDDPRPNTASIILLDVAGMALRVQAEPDLLWIAGDLSALERTVKDRRYTIFGNLGLFFRYTLAALERQHGIISMHASSFYQPEQNRLLVVGGGSGAGKSVYLFEGLKEGYQVFTAEMTFFKISGQNIQLYKGALHDNVWTGSIEGEYAQIIREKLGVQQLAARQNFLAKAVIDLSPVATEADVLHNPEILMLLSRIEQDRMVCTASPITDPLSAAAKVYEVASEKVSGGYILYERHAPPSVDDVGLQQRRLVACQQFVSGPWMRQVRKVVAGPSNCMEAVR
jgi:hypothetical protein